MRSLVLFLLVCSSILAQEANTKGVFISANTGVFYIEKDNFSDIYNSNFCFMPGISLGLPLSDHAYLFCKASYFTKSGTPLLYVPGSGGILKRGGEADYKELLLDFGLMFSINLSENYRLNLDAGLFYQNFNEERRDEDGNKVFSVSGHGVAGIFGGAGIEYMISNSNFSLVGEAQYNLTANLISSVTGNSGGFNLNAGIRFYFNKKTRSNL